MTDVKKGTSVPKEVEFEDLDDLLGTKSATIIVPKEKNNIFSKEENDLSFLDNDSSEEEEEDNEDGEEDGNESKKPNSNLEDDDLSNILDQDLEEEDEEDEDDNQPANNRGRKKLDKDGLLDITSKLIEKGILSQFEDDKPLEEYTMADYEELIEANIADKVAQAAEEAPIQVFGRLPKELQEVVSIALNGEQDIKSVLKSVLQSQEIIDLSIDKEEDREKIVRAWLKETNYGTPDEIEDEITSIIDRGDLEKKAAMFKPKLDSKQASVLKAKLASQEAAKLRAEEAAKNYQETIYNTLLPGDLNGIKLNAKLQNKLFRGLVDTSYQTKDGDPTNLLGKLLEEKQFGEKPDPSIIAEVFWLLSDPEEYKANVKAMGEKKAVAETYRKLKTAEGNKKASSSTQERKENKPTRIPQRPSNRGNFFSR